MKATVHDTFKIIAKQNLCGEAFLSLTQLYMPIIGIDSYGLYAALMTLKENEKYTFKKLLDMLNLGSPGLLNKAFEKLEAVALVRTYHNEQKGYLFRIYPPLPRERFFEDSLLSSFLASQIGEMEMKRLEGEVKVPQIRGYEDVTKSFDEVFAVENATMNDLFLRLLNFKTENPIEVKNQEFDYLFFKMTFDTSFIDEKMLDDEKFKKHILKVAYNYRLNEEEMKDVVMRTITVDKDLKLEDISKNARIYYQKKNKKTAPSFATREPDSFLSSVTDDNAYRFLERLERLTPEQLLQEMNGGIKPSVSELKLIEELMANTNFSETVIKLMIVYVCVENKGVIPGYNYFEKVANTWARAGLKTPQEVLNYINNRSKDRKKKQVEYRKRQVKTPDWYEDYEKQLKELPKEEELSEEEIQKILEEAKNL